MVFFSTPAFQTFCLVVKNQQEHVEVVGPNGSFSNPFEFWDLLQFEPLDRVAVDIPFLLLTDVVSSSPWPLLLASSSLQLLTLTSNTPQLQSQLQEGSAVSSAVKSAPGSGPLVEPPCLCSVVLQTAECATECFCLRCPPGTNDNNTVATGQYLISWRR